AGSGKTRVLTERVLHKIRTDGRRIDDFLIITFTKAAAAELRERISSSLSELAEQEDGEKYQSQLSLIHTAKIGTIDAFCASILRENAHLLDIAPDFRIMEENESEVLRIEALEDLLEKRYDELEKRPGFAALVNMLSEGKSDLGLQKIALETHRKLLSHPDPERWLAGMLGQWSVSAESDAGKTVWGAYLTSRAGKILAFHIKNMERAVEEMRGDSEMEAKYMPVFEDDGQQLSRAAEALGNGWDDAAEAFSAVSFKSLKALKNYQDEDFKEHVQSIRGKMKKAVQKLQDVFKFKSAVLLEDCAVLEPVMRELFSLVTDLEAELRRRKRERGVLSYSDLEHLSLELLIDRETGAPTAQAEIIASRFCEIMVDEYQDVNSIQESIFSALSRGGKNLFMVGDVKQSIYSFRMAEPELFLKKYAEYPIFPERSGAGAAKVLLSKNFRSRRGVLDAVNFVFENIMSTDFGGMEYTEREKLVCGADYADTAEPGFELDLIETGEEDSARAQAAFAAERIKELMRSGMKTGLKGQERELRWGDIFILMRSMKNDSAIYAEKLREAGIPVSEKNQEGFFESREISCLLSILKITDNPRQDIPLIAAMTSPLFGFTADELADIRAFSPQGDFYDALLLAAERNEKCTAFLAKLGRWREKAAELGADELIWYIYEDTSALPIFTAFAGGQSARANLMALYEYAKSFEGEAYGGLFVFLNYLNRMKEYGKAPELPAGETGEENAVHIMSVHKSKGLEAPVVLLTGLSKKFNLESSNAPLLLHRELGAGPKRTDLRRRIKYPTLAREAIQAAIREESLEEEQRILYVAMTRAREKLIAVCTAEDSEKLLKSVAADISYPLEPMQLSQAASMAHWMLECALLREEASELRQAAGTMLPCRGGGERWDIRTVKAGQTGQTAPEDMESSAREPDAELTAEIKARLNAKYPHETAVFLPSKLTATALRGSYGAREAAEEADSVTKAPKEDIFERPQFVREERGLAPSERGTAVHLAMQYAELEKCVTEAGAKAEIERLKEKGVLTAQQAQVIDAGRITAFCSSETGRRALAGAEIKKEFKFSLMCRADEWFPDAGDERVLLQGVVDLCFEENGELVIVDYKTDRVFGRALDDRAESYRRQIEIYARAMERICGKKVREKIIYFIEAGKAVRLA
ncbi:MAG: helicase-exonuclease AddAB subunit AddA, partial [Oscillospiraceae bacterium]|nr:helicase-exonuclease AddAB subunit AddA [Oscillospiraceae bacterium]